jgi:phosphomannomutase
LHSPTAALRMLLHMTIPDDSSRKLFGTDGIRGVANL